MRNHCLSKGRLRTTGTWKMGLLGRKLEPAFWLWCFSVWSHDQKTKNLTNEYYMTAAFLASSDDSFVLSTASDIAADFEATSISTWLITGFNLGYMVSLPIVSQLSIIVAIWASTDFGLVWSSLWCLGQETHLSILLYRIWSRLLDDVRIITVLKLICMLTIVRGASLNIYMSILARIITGFGSSGMLDLSSVLLNGELKWTQSCKNRN